ncbi:hypothetical protein QAD02_009482 [Eretmocerus hayati]|uniref:Uncharacterized protein n=1 Tax=Eretmocerus hayati TaxID=131215 RepID=A0ACC2NBY5_9HYME|nr:hypothetical protein QAD02_009482 [Eretmocerus hayati]
MFLFFFYCGFNLCEKTFQNEKNLRLHLQAAHDALVTVENPQSNSCANSAGKFCCTINVCRKEFDRFSLLSKHLKYHLKAKEQIKCPFKGCKNEYSAITSFTSHLTKKHRKDYRNIPKNVTESVNNVPTQNEPIPVPNDPIESPLCGQSSDSSNHDTAEVSHDELPDPSTLDINRIAQFYLKLESKLLLPVSTIQEIVSEIINLHSESQAIIKEQLKKKLIGEGILPERVQEIVEEVFMSDIFSQGHEVLRTNFRRKKYYKKHFDHVDPEKLDIDKSKKTSFAYIPLLKTLKAVGKDKSVQFHFHKKRKPSKSGVLRDFFDGDAFKKNEFFINNPGALEIILYQDAFEIVNPIGSSKKKHKILAVYMTLGNLPEHLRSHTNTMKLVALCKEAEFDHNIVYNRIVSDLLKLETDGVEISGKTVKGALVYIVGDNLGSHGLGGFFENFSLANYFCRFCLITRKEFQEMNGACKVNDWRTVSSYKHALTLIGTKDDPMGLKFDSVFNKLKYFHVCAPGLPPCIGHDLFEGIVAYDLKMIIDYFVELEWFSIDELNQWIKDFPYSTEDVQDKPCPVSETKARLDGGACQIWNFMRIFPLIIAERIKDPDDAVWLSFLTLTEVVEIVCAPMIHESYLPYLDSLICDYLSLRKKLFPTFNLRPKHHYMRHYAKLIFFFGPLIKVWTMRFESKHKFFKRSIRYSMNFINVLKSLSEKHELFQTYVRLGADTRLDVETVETNPFEMSCNLYRQEILDAIRKTVPSVQNLFESCSVVIKGTEYKKGYVLSISQRGYQDHVVLGKMCLFLSDSDQNIYILFEILNHSFEPRLRAYQIQNTESYECRAISEEMNLKPMPIYKVHNMFLVKPKYGFVSTPL